MQARSALFDLYGDHLRRRGAQAPVSALIRLLEPLGIAAPAVRTAVSRMVRQGWLTPVRTDAGPGYGLTERASIRLDEAGARIYRTARATWDGRFDLVVVTMPAGRSARDRLAAELSFLGYGRLDGCVWVAARRAAELDDLLDATQVHYERFAAAHDGGSTGAAALVARAWDLDRIAAAYAEFIGRFAPMVATVTRTTDDRDAYAVRSRLVHEWRSFLFTDPQLPPALLPDPWPGAAAAAFFDRHAARLRPAADRFVDHCLTEREP